MAAKDVQDGELRALDFDEGASLPPLLALSSRSPQLKD